MLNKRQISAAEYLELESQARDDMNKLDVTRICTFDAGLYIIINYYENVDGNPMTCVV